MSKDYSEILYKVLEESLETQAFMFTESVDINEIAINDIDCVKVSMDFTGDLYNGSLMAIIPNNISNELAANILGIEDTDDEAMELGQDSLKEVLNVICGRVLTEIFGTEPLFDLSIPTLEDLKSDDILKHVNEDNMCSAIIDEMYPIIVQLEKK